MKVNFTKPHPNVPKISLYNSIECLEPLLSGTHCLPQEVLILQSETWGWEWLSDAQTKVKEVTTEPVPLAYSLVLVPSSEHLDTEMSNSEDEVG